MTVADFLAQRTAAHTQAAAIMARAMAPMTLHDHAIAARQRDLAIAADATSCGAKCDTRIHGICDAHRKGTRNCIGHRHNRK